MTSDKQVAANRANGKKSSGPKSEVGKEIAKLNAVNHGGLSPLPVLPEVETRDASPGAAHGHDPDPARPPRGEDRPERDLLELRRRARTRADEPLRTVRGCRRAGAE
jgi:hypothetical protein